MSLVIGGLFGRPGGGGRGSGIVAVSALPTGVDIGVDTYYLRTTDNTLWHGVEDAMNNRSLDAVNSNFRFGTPPVIVADDAARDLYFTNNAGELTQYDNDPNLFIAVGTGFQHRVSSTWTASGSILKGPKGDKGDRGDESRYVVADANVTQTTGTHTLAITGYTAYAAGDQFVFKVQNVANPANPTLRVNALDFERLLKNDGTAFAVSELRQNIQLTATWNGTDFITDFKEESHFHSVIRSAVTVSANGNVYTVTDTDITGFGLTPPQMIYFEAKAANTGAVTLVINGAPAMPVELSDGTAVPAGAIQDGQPMLMVWDVSNGGWRITNLAPTRATKGALLATYTVPTGNYTDGNQPIPGGLVLENANTNIWTSYWDLKYEGVLASDPTAVLYGGGDGWNFYFNSTTEVWRQPVGATLQDGVWQDVAAADVSDMLDSRYPSDTMSWEWLGVVADEAAANAAVTDVDDLTMLPIAYFGGDIHVLSGRSNAVGYKVLDIGFEDVDRRSEIETPVVNPNDDVTGIVVEVLHDGTVVGRSFMLLGYLGFGRIDVELDDGTTIDLSARGSSNYMTIYLGAHANNANVGAGDNVQLNIYEWG